MELRTRFPLPIEYEANYKAGGLEMYDTTILFGSPQNLQFILSEKNYVGKFHI